jgi:Domain of unknown function (DUF4136)
MPKQAAVRWILGLLVSGLLAGCAGPGTLRSDVSSYGDWPPDRRPGSYAFERLPSQQAQAAFQSALEAAALPALQAAGFEPSAEGAAPELLVQVGGRVTQTGYAVWDDPFWWRGGYYGSGYRGRWAGPGWGWPGPGWGYYGYNYVPRYESEVALLIRERSSGKPLYEARARSDNAGTSGETLRAMFEAALKDFPATGINPRSVIVPLAR